MYVTHHFQIQLTSLSLSEAEYFCIEIKCNQLEDDKTVLEDTLEEAYGDARDLRKNFKDITEENNRLKKAIAENLKLKNKFGNKDKVVEKHLTTIKELTENVMILENTVVSRNSEIINLKEEIESIERVNMSDNHKDDDLPSTSNCGNCDYKSDEESEMKLHIESNHSFKCKTCHKIFSSELSLKSHVEDKLATPKTLECETCSYICNTAEKLDKHMCMAFGTLICQTS